MIPNSAFQGQFPYGADIRFRRWGKLESWLSTISVTPKQHRRYDYANLHVTRGVGRISESLKRFDPKRHLNGALTVTADTARNAWARRRPADFDAFVIECFSAEDEPFGLAVEVFDFPGTRFRMVCEIRPGHNFTEVPAALLGTERGTRWERIRLFPEGDAEPRLVFTWLDLVRYVSEPAVATISASEGRPSEKVKCLAWDLDRTLWSGVLLEDGPEGCSLGDDVANVVRALDERGILQTVVSKNEHDVAWAHLESTGLSEYFLYPAINWGQKSGSLRQIARSLNIGIDTFALIDDSPFERAEVVNALPMVRAYTENDVSSLLTLPEFDVPITDTSRQRRQSYLTEMARNRSQAEFAGDYEDFLRSCAIDVELFTPQGDAEISRCYELLARSNQLNLSSRRHSQDELATALAAPEILAFGVRASDRFGDYGIVAFATVDLSGSEPTLRDLVISCRVAQRGIERALIDWLADHLKEKGYAMLRAEFVATARNTPLRLVFEGLPFSSAGSDGARTDLILDLGSKELAQDVVSVTSAIRS